MMQLTDTVNALITTSLGQVNILSSAECSCRRPLLVSGHDSTLWFSVLVSNFINPAGTRDGRIPAGEFSQNQVV